MANDRNSTTRFKINAYMRLAEMTDPDDKAQRQEFINEAVSLLQTILPDVTGPIKKGESWEIIEQVIIEIGEKATKSDWITVTDFCQQDGRLKGFDSALVGRVLSVLGYTETKVIHEPKTHITHRVRYLPVVASEKE